MDKPTIKQIFDALTGDTPDCPPDWCRQVLEAASPEDIARVKEVLSRGLTEDEAAYELGIMN